MALPRWLRRRPRAVPRPADLAEALAELGRCPCDAHRTAFLTVFEETDELLFLVADADTPIEGAGERRVSPDERIALQTVVADERRFLLAFPDEPAALRHDRAAPYAGLGVLQAARRVLEDPDLEGILVTAADESEAWASVRRSHLERMLRPG